MWNELDIAVGQRNKYMQMLHENVAISDYNLDTNTFRHVYFKNVICHANAYSHSAYGIHVAIVVVLQTTLAHKIQIDLL